MTLSLIGPSAGWNGTAGSGYGAPYEPVPTPGTRGDAQAFIRQIFTPNQVFATDTSIFVDANALGGISEVVAYCEGVAVSVTAEEWYDFNDVNGVAKRIYGYGITLDYSLFSASATGTANVYFKAVPTNPSIATRVIGPFAFHPRASVYAGTRTVGAAGNHTTIQAALNWVTTNSPTARNYRILLLDSGQYSLLASATTFSGATMWTTIEADTGVTATMTAGATRTSMRLKYDGIRWAGDGIVFDAALSAGLVTESDGASLWLDGVTLIQTGGRNAVFDGLPPTAFCVAMASGSASNWYATDLSITDAHKGLNAFELARGVTISTLSEDAFKSVRYVHDVVVDDVSPCDADVGLASQVPALDIAYSGAGTPTVEVTGAPNSTSSRSLQVKVDGAAVGTALTITNPNYSATGSGFTTWATVAAHIDALADFTATVVAAGSQRRAFSASKAGLTPTQSLTGANVLTFTAGAAQMTSIFDVHADASQLFSTVTNYGLRFARFLQVNGQGFFVDHTATTLTDCSFRNLIVDGEGNSQLFGTHRHVLISEFSFETQTFILRTDNNYAPDVWCEIASVSAASMAWSGTADSDLALSYINTMSGAPPSGTTNATSYSTDIYQDAAIFNFSPVVDGNLLTGGGDYVGALLPDGSWNTGASYTPVAPTLYTMTLSASTVQVDGSITVTFALDQPADATTTITPARSVVTGAFSPTTVAIAIGETTGVTTFTPTSAGTSAISATNDRSLTNPASQNLVVTALPGPYTQTLGASSIVVGTPVIITYTLSGARDADAIVTPASTLAGTFNPATVTLLAGQLTGVTLYTPSVGGTASLTATNDSSLINPSAATLQVLPRSTQAGGLIKYGIRT